MKICRKCKSEFTGPRCRVCSNAYSKEYQRKLRLKNGVPVRTGCIYGTSSAETARRGQAKWRKLNPEKARAMQASKREKITPGYAASCFGMRIDSVPVEILEAKAVLIRINRKLREFKNG